MAISSPVSAKSLQSRLLIQARRSARHKASALQRPPSWQVATSLFKSFQYAGMGVMYACRTQRNFRIHLLIGSVALSLGVALHLAAVEMSLISITCGFVLALELLNTGLEAVVDLTIGEEYHVLAQIAKDCAAGAVLMAACVAVLVAGFLLLPPGWAWVHALMG